MKLSESDRKIISYVFLDANASHAEVGRALSLKTSTIGRSLSKLSESGLIRKFPLINIHKLGITDFCLFLTHSPTSKYGTDILVRKLCQHKSAAWVAQLGGEFQITASIYASDVVGVYRFLRELPEGMDTFEKSFAVRMRWTNFRPKYLWNGPSKRNELSRSCDSAKVELPEWGASLLRCMASSPDATDSQLARDLSVPVTTLAYRKKKLEEMGIVIGYLYYLNSELLGRAQYRLIVFERNSSADFAKQLEAFALQHPCVSAFVHSIGSWDYELNVEIAEPRDLAKITQELYDRFGASIRNIRALSVLETAKINLFPL